jgi:hypothetical protein
MKNTALALSLFAISGCGAPSTDSVDQFLTNLATQQCAWEFHCCTDPEIKTKTGGAYATQADCIAHKQLGQLDGQYIDRLAVRQGRIKLDDTKAQACLAQWMGMQCNPKPGTGMGHPNPMPGLDACANVFLGVTPSGQPCQFAGECVSGSHCVSDALTPGSGVCVPYQEANLICNETADCDPLAQPQLYCAKQDFKCHARSAAGGPCAYTLDATGKPSLPLLLECDTASGNLYCDPTSNTCKALPTAGQPCLSMLPPGVANSCDPNPALDLVCQTMAGSTTGICTGPAKLNQPCSALIHCDTTANLYCDQLSNTCLALPTLSQSCAMTGECATPYFCNTQKNPPTCDQLAQAGMPCPLGITCDVNLFCDETTNPQMPVCRALLPDGSPCVDSLQCLSRICTGVTNRVCAPSQNTNVTCSGR